MKPIKILALTGLAATTVTVTVRDGGDKVMFPENYAKGVLYTTVDRPDNKQFRELYAPKEAIDAQKAGKPIPSGTVLTMVNYKAKLGADGNPEKDANGRFIKTDEIAGIAVMEKRTGWGAEYGMPPKRIGLSHSSLAPYGVFETADKVPILISIQNDREWAVFCAKVLGRPELARDPRFASNPARLANRAETDAMVARCFGAQEIAQLSRRLEEAEIAFARVNDIEGILRHPHLRRLRIGSPNGPIALPAPPARWVEDDDPSFGPLPGLGEHTQAVRREFLGA